MAADTDFNKKTQLKKKVSPESFLRAFPIPPRIVLTEGQQEFKVVPARLKDVPWTGKRWRVILTPVEQPTEQIAVELAGDAIIGSCGDGEAEVDVNLNIWQGGDRGVSHRHVMLRPAREKLYLIDLGSTNGTHHNGALLTTDRVQTLQQGDLITLGRLHLRVKKLMQIEKADS